MNQSAPAPTHLTWRRPVLYMVWSWRQRHQHPLNFALHLVGIPLAVAGIWWLVAEPWEDWYWGVGAFVLGYGLQYLGHLIEGNDVGEWVAIKRLLGLPYVGTVAASRHPIHDARVEEQDDLSVVGPAV